MAGRIYLNESEYRERVRKDNETRKGIAGVFLDLSVLLIAGIGARWFTGGLDWYVLTWSFGAGFLILVGVAFLRSLEAES
jgi:hypothetical protein